MYVGGGHEKWHAKSVAVLRTIESFKKDFSQLKTSGIWS